MMARWSKRDASFCYLFIFFSAIAQNVVGQPCEVPTHIIGEWFSVEGEEGTGLETTITRTGLENRLFTGNCYQIELTNSSIGLDQQDAKIVFTSNTGSSATDSGDCFICWDFFARTPNVLQYRSSNCISQRDINYDQWTVLEYVCSNIPAQSQLYTLFRRNLETVNCRNTFEGIYHFAYEISEGGGSICDSPNSVIVACQLPGSQYVDNQVFNMQYGACPGVSSSSNKNIRFQCMGEWRDLDGYIWAAIADTGQDELRERFRCLLTREDQQESDNKRWYSMSRFATCDTLNTPYDGDIRLEVVPALSGDDQFFVYGSQLVEPQCNLPRNFSGTWFTTGEFDTDVQINATHIYFKTKIDQYTYRETYFTCQQTIDSRFLMTAVTVGKCEVDYVCFDFVPRHHNIIRWRMSRPFRLTQSDMLQPDYLTRKFRQACSWMSFTIDRTQVDWTYKIFILNPPAPVDCPLAGRYKFEQIGTDSEKYYTRVEGITVRPRHQIDCREYTSELKSCHDNTKKIFVDVEYCATVDHTGRPIGEYDIADNELTCVGYWMEDMRSYMITWDEEDAVSEYRCWVYQRLDWREFVMSRSTRATCGKTQTAYSYTTEEGASLHLHLTESERIYDDCPQRFNDGSNPIDTEMQIYVLGAAAAFSSNILLLTLAAFITITTLVPR